MKTVLEVLIFKGYKYFDNPYFSLAPLPVVSVLQPMPLYNTNCIVFPWNYTSRHITHSYWWNCTLTYDDGISTISRDQHKITYASVLSDLCYLYVSEIIKICVSYFLSYEKGYVWTIGFALLRKNRRSTIGWRKIIFLADRFHQMNAQNNLQVKWVTVKNEEECIWYQNPGKVQT